MQLDAASRSADLKMVQIEEPDTGHTDDKAPKIFQLPGARLSHEFVDHVSRDDELVPIWRLHVAAKVWVVGFNDQVRARIIWILQHDMNVVIGLVFHAANPPDDLIDVKLLVSDAVVSARTTVGRNGIECRDGRLNRGLDPNTIGLMITKALYLGSVESTTRSERRTRDGCGNSNNGPRL